MALIPYFIIIVNIMMTFPKKDNLIYTAYISIQIFRTKEYQSINQSKKTSKANLFPFIYEISHAQAVRYPKKKIFVKHDTYQSDFSI